MFDTLTPRLARLGLAADELAAALPGGAHDALTATVAGLTRAIELLADDPAALRLLGAALHECADEAERHAADLDEIRRR